MLDSILGYPQYDFPSLRQKWRTWMFTAAGLKSKGEHTDLRYESNQHVSVWVFRVCG